jgi:hypothetical protein
MKDLADTYISDLEVKHPLQRAILAHFTYQNCAAYSELVPDGMTGNAFNYHLRALTKSKLIAKTCESYEITPRGKLVLETMSLDATRYKLRPKTCVYIHITDTTGRVLTYVSRRQPLVGRISLPYGVHRLGADYLDSLNRILTRRGIESLSKLPKFRLCNITYYDADQLIAHHTGPCFFITNITPGTNDISTKNGTSHWSKTSPFAGLTDNTESIYDLSVNI